MHDSDWKARYRPKLLSAEQAIKKISRGQRILVGSGAAEPRGLVNALVEHGDHLADNEIVHLLTLGPAPYTRPELAARFRHSAFFIGANVREAVQQGRADFVPVFLSEIPGLIRSRRTRIDVALVQVSPPDSRGYADTQLKLDLTMPGATGLTADQAGAVYNYLLLARGSAGGVHNPLYVRELVFDSVSSITGSAPVTLPVRP